MPTIKYGFVKMGVSAEPERGKVYLDVGNALGPGILDHHQMGKESCSAVLALTHRHFFMDWVRDCDEIEVVMHADPDLDCIASLYILDAILNHRPIEEKHLQILADYALNVDMGRIQAFDAAKKPGLYVLLSARMHLTMVQAAEQGWAFDRTQTEMVKGGLEIVDYFVQAIQAFNLASLDEVDITDEEGVYTEERAFLKSDYEKYVTDLNDYGIVSFLHVPIPVKNLNTANKVNVLVYRDPSACLFKLWARNDTVHSQDGLGFPVLFVIWRNNRDGAARYVISTEPTSPYCLRFLGDVLNVHEKRRRKVLNAAQSGEARPGYDLPDPWYDGRSHQFTIVDTPRGGTILEEDEILAIFSNFLLENCYFSANVQDHRLLVTLPVFLDREPDARTEARRLADLGYEAEEVSDEIRKTFRASFFSLMFSNNQGVANYRKRVDLATCLPGHRVSQRDRYDFVMEDSLYFRYKKIVLLSFCLKLESTRLYELKDFIKELLDYFKGVIEQGRDDELGFLGTSPLDREGGWRLGSDIHCQASVLAEDLHHFRGTQFVEPIVESFLSLEHTAFPTRPHRNAVLRFSDYSFLGMNRRCFVTFQNILDPVYGRESTLEIFSKNWRTLRYHHIFIILKKMVLNALSEHFSRLDVLRLDRNTRREVDQLTLDVFDYINHLNLQNIEVELADREMFDTLSKVNGIAESFEEINASMDQLNTFREARFQKKQNTQMMFLQAIFLIGVVAAIISLGAMPGADHFVRDRSGELVYQIEVISFNWQTLLLFGLLVTVAAFGFFFLMQLAFKKLLK